MKEIHWIALAGILVVVGFGIFIMTRPSTPVTTEEVAKCIGENSILYVQLGCSHCKVQEDMFGNNSVYLNKIDCFYERDKCADIQGTPTWLVNGQKYEGVQSIEILRNITRC
ncbi:MAG: hypothetical protein AABW51_02465 [Nanoarchaeota archaeon]